MPSASLLAWLFTRSLLLPHEPATMSVAPPGDFAASQSVAGLVETTIAAVTSDRFDASGTGTGVAPKIGAYDASWTHTTYRLGDLDITNPLRPGTPLVLPDTASLDRFSIASAPSLVEMSSPGAHLDLAPLRPGSAPSFTFQGIFSPQAWAASPTSPSSIATLRSLEDASFAFSGPIDGDRMGAAISARVTHTTRQERGQPPDQTATLGSFAGHVVIAPRAHDEVRLLGVYQRAEHPLDAWIPLDNPDHASDVFALFQGAWERSDPDRFAWRVAAGVQHAFLDPLLLSNATATIDSVNDGAILPIMMQPTGSTTAFRMAADLKRRPASTGTHDWRVGATFEHDVMHPELLASQNALEFVNGEAARIWQFLPDTSGTTSLWHETTSAIFGADRIKLGDRAWVEGSVRLETVSASNGGASSVSWTDIYPRAAFKATLNQAAGLGVFLDVSRAGMPLPPLAPAFGDPHAPVGNVYQWTDANHDGLAQLAERGPLVARVGPGAGAGTPLSEIDRDLARPAVIQTIAGVSVDRPRWSVALSAIIRRSSNLLQVEDPGAAYTLIQMPDEGLNEGGPKTELLDTYSRTPASFGLDHYVLTNPAGLDSTYEGLDASAQLRSERVVVAFTATAARAHSTSAVRGFRADENDPGVLDVSANPNALVNGLGRPFYDRGYTGKIAAGFRLPHDIRLGMILRYQDGQPFARLAVAEGLTQGPEPIRAYPNGRTRFSFVGTVDVRVQKDFAVGRGRIGVFADMFNLFNTDREVEEIAASSADFRAVSAVEPPFSLRLGLRVRF
jgi:hypothetical protein